MSHFSIDDWADFVRRLTPMERRESMQAHLDQGCRRCGRLAASLSRVVSAASQEAAYGPPDAAVRNVLAYFDLESGRTLSKAVSLPLVFDSRLQPAAAGSRSLTTSARQMLFQSAELSLDLRLEREEEDRRHLVIAGQLVARPAIPVSEAPVYAIVDGRVADTAPTDEIGGFLLRIPHDATVELRVQPEDRQPIAVRFDA